MQSISQYQPALLSMTLLVLAVLMQTGIATIFKIRSNQKPGVPASGDYHDITYRMYRTHMNSLETLPVFTVTLGLAIISGANSWWVNLLAGLYVASRYGYWFFYASNIGKFAGGPRSMLFGLGTALNVALAIMALIAIL